MTKKMNKPGNGLLDRSRSKIKAVATDMSSAYYKAVHENLPTARGLQSPGRCSVF